MDKYAGTEVTTNLTSCTPASSLKTCMDILDEG